jgi:hypothetical protein
MGLFGKKKITQKSADSQKHILSEDIPVKVPCKKCGKMILPTTAKKTGGVFVCHAHGEYQDLKNLPPYNVV